MACVMHEALKSMISAKRTVLIPAGVYASAKLFFSAALEARKPAPQRAAEAYEAYSQFATLVVSLEQLTTDIQVQDRLERYAAFVERLEGDRDLSTEDIDLGQELVRFYEAVQARGDAQDYLACCGAPIFPDPFF